MTLDVVDKMVYLGLIIDRSGTIAAGDVDIKGKFWSKVHALQSVGLGNQPRAITKAY